MRTQFSEVYMPALCELGYGKTSKRGRVLTVQSGLAVDRTVQCEAAEGWRVVIMCTGIIVNLQTH